MEIAKYIDHTLLKPDATRAQIVALCEEAIAHNFFAVCVNPNFVKLANNVLVGSRVTVCTVIGFPLGTTCADTKYFEAHRALYSGARELDMVMDRSFLHEGDYYVSEQEIRRIARLAKDWDTRLKVIIETSQLTDARKVDACMIARNAGADFVKTSTGFVGSGATIEDVALMRATVGPDMGVKASGGITTYAMARAMIEAGANRIGTSKGITICMEEKELARLGNIP